MTYPFHLINGRPSEDPETVAVTTGGRVRLRLINAGSDTAYRFAVGGHRLTVTHADGFPVTPVEVDTLLLGMGERSDVLVTPISGAWPIVAEAEGKGQMVSAVLRTSDATAASPPPVGVRPTELDGQMPALDALHATEAVALGSITPDLTADLDLTGSMMGYVWTINDKGYNSADALIIEQGQKVRVNLRNTTTMFHPMHLHGHTFRVGTDPAGARKDTVIVKPGESISIDFLADNPGRWMMHRHNTYHLEAGMALPVGYAAKS